MQKFNHFDFLAPYYDRFAKPADLTQYSALVGLPVPGLLLDLGGGTGQKTYSLLKMVGGIVIADTSKGMLSQARKKIGLEMTRSEAERLPFGNETFERVIMVDALHHVLDYRLTTQEIWRLTKTGGRIVIEEPDSGELSTKMMALFEKIALMRSHFISPQRIAACFDYANAKISIEHEGSTAWIIIEKQAEVHIV